VGAADDYWLVGNHRIVALFDGGVERIAIDVRDAERGCLRVAYQSWRATGGTARRAIVGIGEANPTENYGTSRSPVPPPSTARPPSMSGGARSASRAKAPINCSSEAM